MNLLALETSTEACSVALQTADRQLFDRYQLTPRGHTQHLPKMLEAVMAESGITRDGIGCVAFANGPGAFTGVRIAASTAQGIALGLKIPLVAVSTLAVLAQQAYRETGATRILSAIDARMGEAYTGQYQIDDAGLAVLQGDESLIPLDALQVPAGSIGVGSAFAAVDETVVPAETTQPQMLPGASALLPLAAREIERGAVSGLADTRINYLRNRVAEKKKTPAVTY